MPTKHKRKRDDDKSNYDLAPSSKAKPLPVIAPTKDFLTPRKKQKLDEGKGKKPKKSTDDTPKAFARLMAWHTEGKRISGGLDDGKQAKKENKKNKAQKQQEDDVAEKPAPTVSREPQSQAPTTNPSGLKIQPGESLGQFGLRVDQALSLSSLPKQNVNPNASLPADLREKEKKSQRLTKHNKRLARMQGEWRNTEAKLKAKEEEELEENVEKLEEEKLLWDSVKTTGKKGKRKVVDDDPWKELEKKRRAEKGRKALALTAKDQVQAPPVLGKVKRIFKEKSYPPHARPPVMAVVR